MVCAASFGHPKVLHLALLNQLFHRPGHVFDGHVRVNAMLIEQINRLDLEPLERGFDNLSDVLGLAVQAALLAAIAIESELGGDDHLPTERSEGFADEFLVGEGAIDFGGVEERDALFDSRPNQGDHRLFISSRTIAKAHAHAAETESRDLQFTFSKFALLHNGFLFLFVY